MNFNRIILVLSMTLASCLLAADGDIGLSATSSSALDVTIPKLIRIAGFTDFNFISTNNTTINADDNLIVSVNYGATLNSRLYQVTATGTGVGGAFDLTNAALETLPMRVWYNDRPRRGGRQILTPGVALINQNRVNSPLSNNTERANMSFRILRADLRDAKGGTYSGTLTFIVAPE